MRNPLCLASLALAASHRTFQYFSPLVRLHAGILLYRV
jgi:hypothetical protein